MATDDVTIDTNHIATVRKLMIEQLQALRNAKVGDDLDEELRRSKGVSELSQTLINSAKVEIDYLTATNQDRAGFLEEPPQVHTGNMPGVTYNSADRMKNALKPSLSPWSGLGSVKGGKA